MEINPNPNNVGLGDEVEDLVSGFKGVVVCLSQWINGCVRVVVQPKVDEKGAMLEAQHFDAPTLKVLKRKKVDMPEETRKTGGSKPAFSRGAIAKR